MHQSRWLAIATLALGFAGFTLPSTAGVRRLTVAETTRLVGGQDDVYNRTFQASCATDPNCTVPSTKLCTGYGYLQCARGLAKAYYNTATNQNNCAGGGNNVYCDLSIATADCVISYSCDVDNNGICYQTDRQSSVAQTAKDCKSGTPQPTQPGGG